MGSRWSFRRDVVQAGRMGRPHPIGAHLIRADAHRNATGASLALRVHCIAGTARMHRHSGNCTGQKQDALDGSCRRPGVVAAVPFCGFPILAHPRIIVRRSPRSQSASISGNFCTRSRST